MIRRLGAPLIVHDAHVNAPEGGTHTNILFEDATQLDLNLVPLDCAQRPADARVLFKHAPVPVAPTLGAEPLDQRQERAGHIAALFWIMVLTTAKYRRRGWDVNVHMMLNALRGHVEEIRRLIAGEPARFRRDAPSIALATTPAAQAAAIRALCDEMAALIPDLVRFGVAVSQTPWAAIERWLD